jgi:hypothetical protein
MTFTRALEVTDRAQEQGQHLLRHQPPNGAPPRGAEGEEGNRESVYDMNYEISV